LPPLPETGPELEAMARSLDAGPDALFLGARATETNLKAAPLDRYRVIAFATHGLMAGDLDLAEPALVLTPPATAGAEDDGLLGASEVAALRLDADWVLLSACNTAAGDGAGAEAVSGLGRGFFYAGSRALLVTHWPVETVSARKLVSGIFERYAKEPALTRAQAVQGAMLAVMGDRAENYSYAHPMFWAPYALVGDSGR